MQGLVGRGSFVVDIDWKDGRLSAARVTARQNGRCVIRTAQPVAIDGVKGNSRRSTIGYTFTFQAAQGRTYTLRPASAAR